MYLGRVAVLAGMACLVLAGTATASFSIRDVDVDGDFDEGPAVVQPVERRLELPTTVQAAASAIDDARTQRRKTIDELFGRLRKQFAEPAVPVLTAETPEVDGDALETPPVQPVQLARAPRHDEPSWVSDARPVDYDEALAKAVAPKPENAASPRYHTIAAGETLSAISRRYFGTPGHWKILASANDLGDGTRLHVGQQIYVPANPARPDEGRSKTVPITAIPPAGTVSRRTAPSETPLDYTNYEWKVYHVKPGDTLSGLAKRFCGSRDMADEMARYNQLASDCQLAAGSNILVPLPKSPEISQRYLLSTQGIFR